MSLDYSKRRFHTSGDILPRILREKLKKYRPPNLHNATAVHEEGSQPPSSRISQLEQMIQKSSQALSGIQKQIQRGEEVYYEETYGFGSLFSGFDSILDARGVSDSNSNNVLRRVPGDARWFSLPLHVYPAPPPPVITNHVPVTVETVTRRDAATSVSKAATSTLPAPVDKKQQSPSSPKDGPDESDKESDHEENKIAEELLEQDEEVGPTAATRETRSKRKSLTPVSARRPKRKKR